MSAIRVKGKSASEGKKMDGWDQAIADAKRHIHQLRLSIKVFSVRKQNGDRWPGKSATQN